MRKIKIERKWSLRIIIRGEKYIFGCIDFLENSIFGIFFIDMYVLFNYMINVVLCGI